MYKNHSMHRSDHPLYFFRSSLGSMVYLTIEELSTVAENDIVVASSLMKDMQPTAEVMYHANAIRVLRKIIDVSWDLLHCVPKDSFYCVVFD